MLLVNLMVLTGRTIRDDLQFRLLPLVHAAVRLHLDIRHEVCRGVQVILLGHRLLLRLLVFARRRFGSRGRGSGRG